MVLIVHHITENVFSWRIGGKYLNAGLLLASVIVLIGLQQPAGWLLLGLSTATLAFAEKTYAKHMLLLNLCVAILAIIPIGTTTEPPQAVYMGLGLAAVVLIPYVVTRYVYKNNSIEFPVLHEKAWHKSRIAYLVFAAILAYLLLPIMLRDTGSYVNWAIEPGFWNLAESYVGLNVVGIWDELFFITVVLAILQKFFPFRFANPAQAVFFTSFLYTLGFEGWSVLVIYPFALIQGYIFQKTRSLLYILAIHLTIDLVLHLSLVYLHLPQLFPYFIT